MNHPASNTVQQGQGAAVVVHAQGGAAQASQQFMSSSHGQSTAPASAPFFITTTAETEDLKRFLATAPQMWSKPEDPPIRSYQLSNGESISCIFWKGKFFITGTDIVKILIFRFAQAGRPVLNAKKFEEGIFSDLRNLKAGSEAVLEEPKSEFLDFLFRHGCIRTQKKQKVFFWNCVPHESLFLDAIERDFKREGSLYHMNMMMNHTRYLQKQVAMMQASALQQQMAPPAPQMMPNSTASRSNSFSGPSASIYPPTAAPSAFVNAMAAAQNVSDPFLINAPLRLPNGKINLNAPMVVAPTPMKAPISRLPLNDLYPSSSHMYQHQHLQHHSIPNQQQPQMFDYTNEFDPSAGESVNFSSSDDSLLSDYLASSSSAAAAQSANHHSDFIDPSSILSLHEY